MSELIDLGIKNNLIQISLDGKRIKYIHQGKDYKFTDPEEVVRAEYYVQLITQYKYKPQRINFEITVPRRTPSDLADIVIYKDDENITPYIVIECKRDGISDSEFEQAIEQAFGNANSTRSLFCGVVAGNTRRFFDVKNYPAMERYSNVIADISVNYGKVQEFRYKKSDHEWDIQPLKKEDLIRLLEKCHSSLWDGGKMDPTEAFDELSKLIFVKIRDEKKPRKKGSPYDFQIKTHEEPDSVYNRIISIYDDAKHIDPNVFNEKIKSSAEKIYTVVNHLQGANLNKTDLDTKGVAFEHFMEDFFKGKQGQYFTPREVVQFILKFSGITHESKVLDPACGSGGFLLHALDYVRNEASEYYDQDSAEHYAHWHDFAKDNLFGIEVNERIARVAKMNMIIHDDGHTNVICHDALDYIANHNSKNLGFEKCKFDFILTNPPFGATIKKEEKPYLSSFNLGKNNIGKDRKTQKTEILFIERCFDYLKPGTGKLAIVIPDGILTNKTQKYVRDYIEDKFEIEAIFSLPQVTFVHYGAGVKSSVLLLRKRTDKEERKDSKIFSAIIDCVGYDSTGRQQKNELPEIEEKYKSYLRGKNLKEDNVFVKNLSQFNNNRLDPYYYSPLFDRIISEMESSEHPLLPLDDVCLDIFSGKTPAKDDYSESIGDPKIIKVATLKSGKVDLDYVQNVKPNAASKKYVEDGDIFILSAAHQADYLGRNPCILNLPKELEGDGITFVGELINIRSNQDLINPYYILQLFNTKKYYLLINREKRGQTSHLYPDDLGKILIPVPADLKLQEKYAKSYISMYKKYEQYMNKAKIMLENSYSDFESEFMPK